MHAFTRREACWIFFLFFITLKPRVEWHKNGGAQRRRQADSLTHPPFPLRDAHATHEAGLTAAPERQVTSPRLVTCQDAPTAPPEVHLLNPRTTGPHQDHRAYGRFEGDSKLEFAARFLAGRPERLPGAVPRRQIQRRHQDLM